MPDAMPMEELERELNPYGVPSFPSVAVSGEGVFETFEKVSQMLMVRLETQLKGDASKSTAAAPAPAPAPAAPPPPAPAPSPAPAAIDSSAVREVKEAIQSSATTPAPAAAAPPPPPPPPLPPAPAPPVETVAESSDLVIQRGFDSVSQGVDPVPVGAPAAPAPEAPAASASGLAAPAPGFPEAAAPAPPAPAPRLPEPELPPAAPAPTAPAATSQFIAAPDLSPVSIEKSLVLPVAITDLQAGRKIRLVLDVTLDPEA